jgi:iron(III) transport system substrate-binding protein
MSLAEQRFAGDLCLSSSQNRVNQLVMSMLIDRLGVRETQTIVRGWIENLALPPLNSGDEVLAAIAKGQCKLGIVSSSVASATDLSLHTPAGAFADIDAIGIARHAHNPDGALVLLDWLTARSPISDIGSMSDKNAGLFAWHQSEAILLAERVNYD